MKLAAALLALKDENQACLIPWTDAQQMTAYQIISLFHFDHYPIRAEAGGPSLPWNLVPRLILAHRRKTAKQDLPAVAKIKRVSAAEEAFRQRLLAKTQGTPKPRSRWPRRPLGRKDRI